MVDDRHFEKKSLNKLQYLSNAMVLCHTSYTLPNKTANIIKTKLESVSFILLKPSL